MAGRTANYTRSYYGTTKGSVIQFTKACATEWALYSINVNGIGPGRLWTPFWELLIDRRIKQGNPTTVGKTPFEIFEEGSKTGNPLGRAQTPEDIGTLAAFLASEDAKNITGRSIQVDGGKVMV